MLPVLVVTCCAQVNLTAEDVTALFLENALRAQSVRVHWTRTSNSRGKAEYSKSMMSRFEEAKKRTDLPEEIRARVNKEVKGYKSAVDSLKTRSRLTHRQDYWSDRAHFQVRSPFDAKEGGPFSYGTLPGIEFPDVEATRDRLSSEFASIYIMSYGRATENRFRVWDGHTLVGGRHAGQVLNGNSSFDCYFPPLALPKRERGGLPHPIDEFYLRFLQKGRAKVLGEFELAGVKTILIDARVDNSPIPGVKESSARAFVDVERAGLPLRIEFFHGSIDPWANHFGLCVDHPKLIAERIITDIVTDEIDDGTTKIIYPVGGIIQRISRASSSDQALSRAQPEAAVHEETLWQVEKVEMNRPMSEENFALAFPPNTVFRNEATNELLVTGDMEGYVERLVMEATRQKTTRSSVWVRSLVIALGTLAALGALVYYRSWRRKAR